MTIYLFEDMPWVPGAYCSDSRGGGAAIVAESLYAARERYRTFMAARMLTLEDDPEAFGDEKPPRVRDLLISQCIAPSQEFALANEEPLTMTFFRSGGCC